jgi:hypothetical protein
MLVWIFKYTLLVLIIVLQGKISFTNFSIISLYIIMFSSFGLEVIKYILKAEYFFLHNNLTIFQSNVIKPETLCK